MAPASYEEVELLEADRDAQRPCKKARPFGVVVAILAVLGLVGVASLSHNQVSATQHLSVARKALLKAFSPRSLAEAAKLTGHFAFTLHQDSVPLDAHMSIKSTMSVDEDPPEGQRVEIDISAEEGKGEDLKAALLDIVKAMQEQGQPGPDEQGRRLQEDDEKPFTVDVNEDIVTFTVPIPEDGPELGDMAEQLKFTPTGTSSIEFGRTLEEMCDNQEDRVPMVFNGFRYRSEASFGAIMAKVAEEMENGYGAPPGEGGPPPGVGHVLMMLKAFTKLSADIELAYRDPSELGELKDLFPPFGAAVGMLTQHVQEMPEGVKEAVKKLDGLSAGTKRIAVRGLPEDYQVVIELSKFNLAPVLKKMIDDL